MFQMQQQQQYAAFINSQQKAMQAANSIQRNDQALTLSEVELNGQSKAKESPSDKTNDDIKAVTKVQAEELEKDKPGQAKTDCVQQIPCEKVKGPSDKEQEKIEDSEKSCPEKKEENADIAIPQPQLADKESANAKRDDVKGGKINKLEADNAHPPCECFDGTADSGCASDVSSGNEACSPAVPCDVQSNIHNNLHSENNQNIVQCDTHSDNHSDSSSQHSTSNLSLSSSGSECGSLNLYSNTYHHMPLRGRSMSSHKLLKPLKDIPPRFQKMLSCNPAIKQDQFEGQPIMRHSYHHHHSHKTKSVTVSAGNMQDLPNHHSFNPNAETFIPRQYVNSPDTIPSPTFSPSGLVTYDYSTQSSIPTDCCSLTSSDGMGYSTASPASTSVSSTNPGAPNGATPTYTIHIFSSNGSNVETTSYPYTYGNHGVSGPSSGFYGTNPALPAPPHSANSYPTNQPGPNNNGPSQQAPPPPPPAPPGGIVYYCQPQNGYNQNYNSANYNMHSNGGVGPSPQYMYSPTPGAYPPEIYMGC